MRYLLLLGLVYAGFALLMWIAADRMIFMPPAERYARTPDILLLPRDAGGVVAAVHLRNPRARYTVLYSHGNGEDLAADMPFLRDLRDAGFNVLAYDYSGYGLSTGRPSEQAAYADEDAAYDYLTRSAGVPGYLIIAHGRSLGGGPAAELASRRPVAGLVLESTFTSVGGVFSRVRVLPFDRFRTVDKLPRVTAPVLVIHGTADEVIPFAHGQRLRALAPGQAREFWVQGAGHNDLVYRAGEAYFQTLRDFAASLPAPPARQVVDAEDDG